MEKRQLVTAITEDHQIAVLEIVTDGESSGYLGLSAPELDEIIHRLGDIRQQMSDRVPPRLDVNPRLPAIDDPAWHLGITEDNLTVTLAIRHPGFGWLGFSLPQNEAKHLGELLTSNS
ncbi:MAG: hypothetical protein RLZZ141_2324 [Pseudomonadota bacterium]|jgi:hypothetical protein